MRDRSDRVVQMGIAIVSCVSEHALDVPLRRLLEVSVGHGAYGRDS